MPSLDEMKKQIEALKEQVAILEGFSKGRTFLYEKVLEENEDLKRQLEDEKKVRKIMRDAVNEHVTERDTVMEDMAREFFPDSKNPDGSFIKFGSLKEMASKCMIRNKNAIERMKQAERQVAHLTTAKDNNTPLQDYIAITVDGKVVGYKAASKNDVATLATQDGYALNEIMTKEEYEFRKWG